MSKVLDLNKLYSLYNRNPNDIDNIRKINRFRMRNPNDELAKTTGYVFFVRPDLNILSGDKALTRQAQNCPEFVQAFEDYIAILYSLNRAGGGRSGSIASPFINMITGSATSFTPQDATIDMEEVGETFVGYKMNYGKFTADSMNGGEISIKYRDNRFLEIYKLHHVWYSYIMHLRRGKINPKKAYIDDKILDYQTSAYYFVVAEDGESIVYAAKYFGIFPKNIPSSAFAYTDGEGGHTMLEYDISYNWTFRDDYNYMHIFKEFNDITKNTSGSKRMNTFNRNSYTMANMWAKTARIEGSIRDQAYKLKFYG